MLSVIICENDEQQRNSLEEMIKNYLLLEELDMTLVLATGNPIAVLDYLYQHPQTVGVYFIDIDLDHKLNGFELAVEIRKTDCLGKIIIISGHIELAFMTFTYKIEAVDFIVKTADDQLQENICQNLQLAHIRQQQKLKQQNNFFQVKLGDRRKNIKISDIILFEASCEEHRILLHTQTGQIEFYETLKNLERSNPQFFRCHKSYLVNRSHILAIDKKNRKLELSNGMECLVAVRGMKALIKISQEEKIPIH